MEERNQLIEDLEFKVFELNLELDFCRSDLKLARLQNKIYFWALIGISIINLASIYFL